MNRATAFANRVRRQPGRRIYVSVSFAAVLFAAVSGPFGTGDLPLLRRLLFWLLLIGFNSFAWMCWFAWRVRGPKDWWRAALIGAIVLNLPLPLEVTAATALVDGDLPSAWPIIWVYAAILSLALLLVIVVAMPTPKPAQGSNFAKGALWRAGARQPADVLAIGAEDHYCRVYLPNGSSPLVHGRFSDLVDELGDADGLIVRRGQWVAAHAVRSIERQNRRWIIQLEDRFVPVASSSVEALRARGWL